MSSPLIIGIGGTPNPGSSTECALELALGVAARNGMRTRLFDGEKLQALPFYSYGSCRESAVAQDFVAAIREAAGLVIASPGYHGSISGLIKNALDYVEETARDERVYLDGLPVGLIVTAYGWQATGSTLNTLRSIVHALRGWPTPFGAGIKTAPDLFVEGACSDEAVRSQVETVGQQVVDFVRLRRPLCVDA